MVVDKSLFIVRFVIMLIICLIPFFRVEKMIYRLRDNVKNGGWLPACYKTYYNYLDETFNKVRHEVLKEVNKENTAVVIVDESTDRIKRPALDIILWQPSCKPLLIDIKQMQRVNYKSVSTTVASTLGSISYPYENVVAFVSDGAAYMKKAWVEVLSSLFGNAIFVICYCHCLNLVIEDFFECTLVIETFDFMRSFTDYFAHSYIRSNRWYDYQLACGLEASRPPKPSNTRWNYWIGLINYHNNHLNMYSGFFKNESDIANNDTWQRSGLGKKSLDAILEVVGDPKSSKYMNVCEYPLTVHIIIHPNKNKK
jgi:hypothetical protein